MKRLFFVLIFFAISSMVFAQKQYEPKGKVSKAENALNQGKLDIAKAEIDKAFADNEKGKVTTDGKNWYIRGKIYKAIYMDTTTYHDIAPDALDKAVESYKKVKELEKENSTYAVFSEQEMNQLYGVVVNKGAADYNNNNFEAAYDAFMEALKVSPGDTIALLYGGTAAQQADMTDKAIDAYNKLIDVGTNNIDVYKTLIFLYRNEKQDLDKVLGVVNKALEKFPDNKDFAQEKITTLINLKKTDEAQNELKNAIAKEPSNPLLYYELGYLYDYQDKPDEALDYYKQALKVDPNHYEANYNAGVVYYNKAAQILKELNNLPLDEYRKKEDEYYNRAVKFFEQALPYLEKASQVMPKDDLQLLETLEGVYIRLKMNDKAEALEKKIKALGGDIDKGDSTEIGGQ